MGALSAFKVEAEVSLELDLTVSGSFEPGYAGSWNDPGAEDEIHGLDIEGLAASVWNPKHGQIGQPRFLSIDLMDGVNIRSPDIQRLIQNILGVVKDQAVSALLEEG